MDPDLDRAASEAKQTQLPPGHHPVLPSCQQRQQLITWSVLCTYNVHSIDRVRHRRETDGKRVTGGSRGVPAVSKNAGGGGRARGRGGAGAREGPEGRAGATRSGARYGPAAAGAGRARARPQRSRPRRTAIASAAGHRRRLAWAPASETLPPREHRAAPRCQSGRRAVRLGRGGEAQGRARASRRPLPRGRRAPALPEEYASRPSLSSWHTRRHSWDSR